jgi:polar amino acid transport system substrate-binding protein
MNTSTSRNRRLLIYISLLVLVLGAGYLALSAVSVGNPRPATPVRLISGDWQPFVGSDLPENGPVARIVTETFQRMGYEPEISFTSWDLILDQTGRVEVLGAFPFIASDSRRERYAFSDPILEFDYVLFYYRPHVPEPDTLTTPDDFVSGGYQFGKVEGYDVWPTLANAGFEFREYPTREDAFQALVEGEIDFLPEGRLVGEVVLKSAAIPADFASFGALNATDNNLLGASESLYLLLPKTDSARRLLNRFNRELAQVKATNVYHDALAEINQAGSTPDIVELQPAPGSDVISVTTANGDTYLVPSGSRALVIAWPAAFEEPAPPDTDANQEEPPMLTVKLLNGPLQGRVVQVDAHAARLVDASCC